MLKDIIDTMNDAGMRVFPLLGSHDADGDKLDEKEAFKRPRYSGWQHTPSGWSDEQLEVMFETGQFETGYGIVCRDIVVIDIDPRNGGNEAFDRLLQVVPEIAGAGMIVETGRRDGGKHYYFKAPVPAKSLVQHIKGYDGIDIKSSGYVVGPGSQHASGNDYRIIHGSPDDIDDLPHAFIEMIARPEYHRTTYNGASMDVTHHDLAEMLSHLSPDVDHDTWIRCGMAVHDASQGSAFAVWDDWSAKGATYPGSEKLEERWHSFGKSTLPVTIGTLIVWAEEAGWKRSVIFDQQEEPPVIYTPLDTDAIDLLRPPGFVGEVKQWIDDQCRYPREHLSTAAALISVGNVIGLRYTDDTDRATANLLAFGVAGSSSGKESVMQAMQAILVETGISAASHGSMKSQQEIMRNLIRHQAAYYVIDEFGIELRKVVNAQKKGTAAYLEGLIGTIMSIYSKADGKALLSGDVKEDVRKALVAELSQVKKRIENNEAGPSDENRLDRTQKQLDTLDEGLDRPFLSLMGFTTPSTFDDIIDEDQATSGFLGRAILVREHETNPRPKWPFKKKPMPDQLRQKLRSLFQGGSFDMLAGDRVEHVGPITEIRTTPEAVAELREALNWTLDYAEDQKEKSGLEAVVRRGYEMIAKVSLILAAQEGVRTIEHVRWAFALVKRDINEKIRLVLSNDVTRGMDKNLMAQITKIISKDHGETFGVIKNRLRKYKPEDVQKALDLMIGNTLVRKEITLHKQSRKEVVRYFFEG